MIIPIRCFTCNSVISHLWEKYLQQLQMKNPDNRKDRFVSIDGLEQKTVEGQVLDSLGLTKYCCRRMILSHVDSCDKI